MPTAFMLYCRLVFWAALSSSVSRANSIISIIVVIAGTAMLFAPSFGMTIDASALVTTLRSPMFLAVLVGSVILVRLVCVQYWIWTKERDARIKAEETITQLEQRRAILDAGKPYPIGISDAVSWRIKIHNNGASATNVKMDLWNITSRPKSQILSHDDFPFPVVQAGAGFTINSNECNIPRGSGAVFQLTPVWHDPHSNGFLTTLNTRVADTDRVRIEPDEQWEKMEYRVTADNAETLIVTLRMQIRNGEITFERVA